MMSVGGDGRGVRRVLNGGETEFRRLYKDLHPAATKWKKIGIELSCPPEQLNMIERKQSNRDDSDFLYDMLIYRRSRTEPSELTWEVIYTALLSSIVGESKLAKKVAKDHCPHVLKSNGERLHREDKKHKGFTMTGVSLVGAVVTLFASVLFAILLPYITQAATDGSITKIPKGTPPVSGHEHQFSSMVPLYRYWKSENADHFYTKNANEIGTKMSGQRGKHGYVSEGIQCYVYEEQVEHSVPLYRYWKSAVSDHFYTTDVKEIGTITPGEIANYGYKSEGIVGYCFPNKKGKTVPLYRYWNPRSSDHFYTTNGMQEIGTVTPGETGNGLYISEGVACYVEPV